MKNRGNPKIISIFLARDWYLGIKADGNKLLRIIKKAESKLSIITVYIFYM